MFKFWKNQRLLFKLISIVLVTILITLTVLYILLSQQMAKNTQENAEENLLQIGRQLAQEEQVILAVETGQTNPELIQHADSINDTFELDYTVVMTRDSIRLTHPDRDLIYQHFIGSDQSDVFQGKEYTSIGEGTLGRSLRAFVPVYNTEDEVFGAISLGLTIQTLEQIMQKNSQPLTIAFSISVVIGVSLATLAAYSLKRQMLNMEPHEIARVLEERNAMMEYANDAVFVTNNEHAIILANQEAKKEFNVKDHLLIQHSLPFLDGNRTNLADANQEDKIYTYKNKEYVVSIAPILVDDKFVGNLYTLRDATELYMLTRQLYSSFDYTHTLEAQSHDFLNKLHVIYGLTDLEEYDELKRYLEDFIEPEQEFSKRVAYLIQNPVISGFLVGERRKFSENQLPFTIEVYPDIPATGNFKFTEEWIKRVDFINKLLLKVTQITEVHFELGYFDEKILTTYQIRGNMKDVFQQITQSEYKDSIQEYGSGWLTIYFECAYEKDTNQGFQLSKKDSK